MGCLPETVNPILQSSANKSAMVQSMVDLGAQYDKTLAQIAQVVQDARLLKNQDQRSIERAVGLSKGYISKLENCTDNMLPALETILRIAAELDADRDRLAELVLRGQVLRLLHKQTVQLQTEWVGRMALQLTNALDISRDQLQRMKQQVRDAGL